MTGGGQGDKHVPAGCNERLVAHGTGHTLKPLMCPIAATTASGVRLPNPPPPHLGAPELGGPLGGERQQLGHDGRRPQALLRNVRDHLLGRSQLSGDWVGGLNFRV